MVKIKCRFCQKLKEGFVFKSYRLKICPDCFLDFFRKRIEKTIGDFSLFSKKDKILVAISGGKDSTALAKVLKDLGFEISLCHINCQIKENSYSQKSQKKVEEFAKKENLNLKILDLKKEIGVDIKTASKIFKRPECAVCGMVKRYLLNREAKDFDVIVTGHTLWDEAGNLLKSLIFWQEDFLEKQFPLLKESGSLKRKAKPLSLVSERETELFCKILNLPYLAQKCPLRGGAHIFFKNLIFEIDEKMPSSLLNFYKGFLKRKGFFQFQKEKLNLAPCQNCGYLTQVKICNFCRLKEKIEKCSEKKI